MLVTTVRGSSTSPATTSALLNSCTVKGIRSGTALLSPDTASLSPGTALLSLGTASLSRGTASLNPLQLRSKALT